MKNMEGIGNGEFDLPGFRFHPTEEELVGFYLKKKLEGQQFSFDIIGTLDLYKHDPWELPGLAYIHGEREWFFFVPRDTKSTAPRRSRLTASGYWKATGSDKPVRNKTFHCIGLRKTLVFYRGKAPTGEKTDWVMKEYRMPDFCKAIEMQKEVVLCHIHRKATSKKTLEQRSMAERGEGEGDGYLNIVSDPSNSLNWSHHYYKLMNNESESCVNKCDDGEEMLECRRTLKESKMNLAELQVPSLYVESLFSPWTDIINSWTPSILFCPPKEEYHCNNI